ncbi:MAG: hypothetical protein DRP88_04875 [Candidatus Neomarinimicrobiota bacterium]|nr:MAG: hypothetical protein DRP88_04875 [Candidatus Neomarinimicrobiota bacterium]
MLKSVFNKVLRSDVKKEGWKSKKLVADVDCWRGSHRLIDFVDFDDIKLFMYKNDSVYDGVTDVWMN